MKPNIFDLATKELSQDAFITWLLQWADPDNASEDIALNLCGIDFITELIKKKYHTFNEKIKVVSAGRQWKGIDIWVKVNNKYLIIVEDKTFSGQHSGQLKRYKNIAEKWCTEQSPRYHEPICIYMKTGNESRQSLDNVIKDGFLVFNRQDIINILNCHKSITNNIFIDFQSRLIRIENHNNEWEEKRINDWNGSDWQGFFQYLERSIGLIGWNYVNNPSGGFWNAVLEPWSYWNGYPLYIQIEQFKLCFKLSTDPAEGILKDTNRIEVRNKVSELILQFAKNENRLAINRPKRFGTGKYMTVAIVDCENWLGNKQELIRKEEVVEERLLLYKNFLQGFIASTNDKR